jgi:hypothetical protein
MRDYARFANLFRRIVCCVCVCVCIMTETGKNYYRKWRLHKSMNERVHGVDRNENEGQTRLERKHNLPKTNQNQQIMVIKTRSTQKR